MLLFNALVATINHLVYRSAYAEYYPRPLHRVRAHRRRTAGRVVVTASDSSHADDARPTRKEACS